MRFDPTDRSLIEIDIPKRREQLAREHEQHRQDAISRGEAQLESAGAPASPADDT